jgi:hypothetical protein
VESHVFVGVAGELTGSCVDSSQIVGNGKQYIFLGPFSYLRVRCSIKKIEKFFSIKEKDPVLPVSL